MKHHAKILSLLLALVLLASGTLSCSDSSSAEAENENTTVSADVTEETAAETTDPEAVFYEDLPTADFEGKDFNILVPAHLESEFAGELSGDVIENAVYERNLAVEEALGIKINAVPVAGLWDDQSIFLTAITSSVMALDDAYQLISGYAAYITSLASSGSLANWNEIPDVNFEKPWWNSDIVEEMNVGGKLYYVTGDLSLTSIEYLFCLFFNKGLVADFGLEDPYTLVNEGKWTLDKITEYTSGISFDANGDGKMDENDFYGYISDDSNYISGYQAAFDANITVKDSDGIPRLAIDTEEFMNKFSALYTFLRESPSSYLNYMSASFSGENEVTAGMFKNGNALIMADMLGNAAILRDSDVEFGILPYPKYTEEQENYHTTSWDAYTLFCIPVTSDPAVVGIVTENLAAQSHKTVIPAFYDVALKSKYARDTESAAMIDLIREGATYNFGTVNSIHCASCGHIFRSLVQGSNPNIASYIASNSKAMTNTLDKFVEKSYLD